MDGGEVGLDIFSFLPTAVFLASQGWPMLTSSKQLSVKDVITTNGPVEIFLDG
jgi:hypothetical protein